jgi:hypothetical protein
MTTAMTDERRHRVRAALTDLEQELDRAVNAAADVRDDGLDASAFDVTAARFERAVDALHDVLGDRMAA